MKKIEVLDYSDVGEARIFMGEAYGKDNIPCDRTEMPHENIVLGYQGDELVVVIINTNGIVLVEDDEG